MSINSKFIYAKTRTAFEAQIPNIPAGLNPIAFIEDTKEMWTCGTYFSIGYPGIRVTEISGVIKIEIGNTNFTLETSGESLSITKGTGNSIILTSNALIEVATEAPLEWNSIEKKLYHSESTTNTGNFGQSAVIENASIFNIPYLTVDKYGHITAASSKAVSIRDYVEQIAPTSLDVERNILLSYNAASSTSDTTQVRKSNGLTFNDLLGILTIPGGIKAGGDSQVTGDFIVINGEIIGNLRGNVTGEATPKIHLSDVPEYGGASTMLYGHVRVQDTLTTEPPASSVNEDTASSEVTDGVAASPKMVWDTKQELLGAIADVPTLGGIDVGLASIEITVAGQRLKVSASQGVEVTVDTDELIFKGIAINGYDISETYKSITGNLTLGTDFSVDSENEVSIRWTEIP